MGHRHAVRAGDGARHVLHAQAHLRVAVRQYVVTAVVESGDPSRPVIEPPRARRKRPSGQRSKTNFEMYAWVFMRMSGLLLFVLVLWHLLIMNIVDGGVQRV